MLENIGFKYTFEVDPFDGGPHYRCPLKDIKPIKEKITGQLVSNNFDPNNTREVLIQVSHPEYDFFAFKTQLQVHGDGQVSMDPEVVKKLGLIVPQKITAIPFS
jgi:arginine N-succinyltransferase